MKKPAQPFFFKDLSHQEVADLLDQEYPVSLKHNEDLVNRVHQRYPILKKAEVALIITKIFQSLRQFLILGKMISVGYLFSQTRLIFSQRRWSGKIYTALKIRTGTPASLKKDE
jgi:hypothetical protein